LIFTVVMFQAQSSETINSTWKCVVSWRAYGNIVFYKATPDLQDQDKGRFLSQTGLVLRPTVSDHITAFLFNATVTTIFNYPRQGGWVIVFVGVSISGITQNIVDKHYSDETFGGLAKNDDIFVVISIAIQIQEVLDEFYHCDCMNFRINSFYNVV